MPSRVGEQIRAEKRRSLLKETERLDLLQRLTTHLAYAPEAVLFEAALEAINKGLGLPSAAVLTCINGPMTFRAWHSLSASYRNAVPDHSPWDDDDPTPAPILIRDALHDPRLADYKDLLRKEGIGALAFLPIMNDGRLMGKFMLYNAAARDWTDSDIAYGQTVAALVSLTLKRTLVEETLHSSNVGLTSLAQYFPIGVVLTDASRRIQFCNPPFLDHLGVSTEEPVIGQPVERIAEECRRVIDPVAFLGRVYEIIRSGVATPGEDLHLHGGTILQQAYCPVRADGVVIGYLWSYRDVTEQRWMERQLFPGAQMESFSLRSGGMAHHFNNLLTSIFEYSCLAQKEPEPDRMSLPFLEQLIRVAGQTADITRQLNAFAAGKPNQGEALDLTRSVWEAAGMLQRLLGTGIKLTCHGLENPAWVTISPAVANQVLINVVVNARDAMPQGGEVRITVSVGHHETTGAQSGTTAPNVLLSVEDTGLEMDEVRQKQIFEPSFTTKDLGSGAGSELSTCYRIVAAAGGTMDLETTPGQGRIFRILLPLASPETREDSLVSHRAEVATVLLVEDESLVREVLCEALNVEGYRVVAVANGAEALAVIAEGQEFDILVTDAAMPGMTGTELVLEVRRHRPGTKALLISGYVGDRSGGDEDLPFLQKPFMPEAFAQRVAGILNDPLRRLSQQPGVA